MRFEFDEITEVTVHYVTTTDSEIHTLRRNGPDNWEYLIGESWEPVYDCRDLEREFQKHRGPCFPN
jgi:hypothetical protein